HTRFSRDWSSDVCSSDLYILAARDNYNVRLEPRTQRGYITGPVGADLEHEPLWVGRTPHNKVESVDKILEPAQGVAPRVGSAKRSEERRVGKGCSAGWGR